RILHACKVQQRWGHRSSLHCPRNPTPRSQTATSRRFHDQRNVHRRVISEESVLVLSVFAERFAVVAEHNNEAVIVELTVLQPTDQSPQLMISVSDLSVIQVLLILPTIRFRRIVRTVRVVKMQPKEKRADRLLLVQAQRPI